MDNYYTKQEADSEFLTSNDLDNYYTKTEADDEFVSSTDYEADKEEYIVYSRPSVNLYDKSLMLDHKIMNYNSNSVVVDYNNGILTGYIPVEEGKTYTITSGTGSTNMGALCFFGTAKNIGLCGGMATDPMNSLYGGGSSWWPSLEGKVTASYNEENKSNTFTVLEGSGIKYVMCYVKRIGTSDSAIYWGSHTDLSVVDSHYKFQMVEGSSVLPYEEYGVTITKTRYQEGDEALEANFNSEMADFESSMNTKIDTAIDTIGKPKLTFTINGNVWSVSSTLYDNAMGTHPVSLSGLLANGTGNGQFEFSAHKLDNSALKASGDDITPLYGTNPNHWKASYIGANHGHSGGKLITVTGHGKDASDIGSTWKDSSNANFVIYAIPDEDHLKVMHTGCTRSIVGNTLTHVTGATHTETMTKAEGETVDQMFKAVNSQTLHIYDANWKEIPLNKNATYNTNLIRFVISYQILNPDSAIAHLQELKAAGQTVSQDNLSDIEVTPFARQNLYYEVHEGCAVTLYQTTDFLDNFTGDHGAVQSGAMSGTATESVSELCYVPGAFENTPFEILSSSSEKQFLREDWTKSDNPPYRFYQFGPEEARNKGFMQGFYTKIGAGIPETRNANITTSAGFIYKTGKMYPQAYKGKEFHAGDQINVIAFYTPFEMNRTNDANCFASVYNYVYDDIILALDYQAAGDVLYKLRPECVGKKIEVLDKTDSCTMIKTMANSELLPISFSEKGWIVLRFTCEW